MLTPTNYLRMPIQRCENFQEQQNVYIGLDVHLKQWNVCIIQGGRQRKPFQQNPSAETLKQHLQKNYPGLRYYSAYEAGVCGCSIHYDLISVGIDNIIFNAADVSQTGKERVRKTDAVDAAKIARSLANGDLSCIHIPPRWRVADRNMLRLRSAQVSDLKRLKIRLRHYLHVNGIRIPAEFSSRWTLGFIGWLKGMVPELDSSTGYALSMMVARVEDAIAQVKAQDRRLLELMKHDNYARDYALLRSVPGVGAITAVTLLLECGDLSDFPSAESFCAFVGLVPDTDISDGHKGKCGITRRRHKTLRYMLTECAWRATATDEELSGLYAAYSRRMPPAKAIVKIANKLAKRIKFVLRNKTAYAKNR